MVMLWRWPVVRRENGHVTEVVTLIEGKWSCYRGGQCREGEWLCYRIGKFNGGRMVMLQFNGGRMIML